MTGQISGERPYRRSRLVVPVTQPAAGSDWSLTVPAGHLYHVLAVYALLTASAAVATRIPRLQWTDGITVGGIVSPIVTVTAGTADRNLWLPAIGAYKSLGNDNVLPIPSLYLAAGWTIGVVTAALDVADQWSGIALTVVDSTVEDGSVDLDSMPDFTVALTS